MHPCTCPNKGRRFAPALVGYRWRPWRARLLVGLVASYAFLISPAVGRAAPVTYTAVVNADGDLGAVRFTNRTVTLTATGETTDIVDNGGALFLVPADVATVSVSGVGSGTFTFLVDVFVNQSVPAAGISGVTSTGLLDILFVSADPFATYDLTTSIGPVSGLTGGSAVVFPTTSGNFDLRPVIYSASFQASVAPEPTSAAILAIAILAVRRSRGNRVA